MRSYAIFCESIAAQGIVICPLWLRLKDLYAAEGLSALGYQRLWLECHVMKMDLDYQAGATWCHLAPEVSLTTAV